MFDVGLPELLVILGVALIVLGPQKLPELARTLGKALAELRRTSDDLRRNVLLGEGLEEDARPQAKTTTVGADPQKITSMKETGNSEETSPEKGIKHSEASETAPSPPEERGLDG